MSLKWTGEVGEADWWVASLHPFAQDVGALVTGAYPAVARVFHPVIGDFGRRRRWHDVAVATGRVAHPAMQFNALVVGASNRIGRPRTGTLDFDSLQALVDALVPFTTTPDQGWFAVWEGFGQLSGSAVKLSASTDGQTTSSRPVAIAPPYVLSGPRVEAPYRRYLLHGPLNDAAALYEMLGSQSPSVWWPQDRGWLVATEVDLDSTYVAGSDGLVASLVTNDRLEVLPIPVDAGITFDSDNLNPLSENHAE
jgi:hypothetical protein